MAQKKTQNLIILVRPKHLLLFISQIFKICSLILKYALDITVFLTIPTFNFFYA